MEFVWKPECNEKLIRNSEIKANIHISGVGDIIKSFDKKSTTKDTLPTSFLGSVSLATAFQHYGDALRENGDQTVLTTALLKLGEAQSAINKHRIAADTDVQDKFLKPLCNFIINEGKQNTKMKETFGKVRKSYEADLSRVRENEASRVADLQKTYSSLVDYHSSSTELFFTQHHYQETLDKINLESKADIMKGIKEFICAQKNFFQNALSSLETLEKNITELDNAAQMQKLEYKTFVDNKKKSFDESEKALEKSKYDNVSILATTYPTETFDLLTNLFPENQDELTEVQNNFTEIALNKGNPLIFIRDSTTKTAKTSQFETLDRSNNARTRYLSAIARVIGKKYVQTSLINPIGFLKHTNPAYFEINAISSPPNNVANLTNLCQLFIDSIFASTEAAPLILRQISRIIYDESAKAFGEQKGIIAVGGFLFLRFFCLYIMSPGTLTAGGVDPEAGNVLRLVAKVIQNLANNISFGVKEQYMTPLNPLLEKNIKSYNNWIKDFINVPLDVHVFAFSHDKIESENLPNLQRLILTNFKKIAKITQNYSKTYLFVLCLALSQIEFQRKKNGPPQPHNTFIKSFIKTT